MRKVQKQQAAELMKQIEEAHDQIKKYIDQDSIMSMYFSAIRFTVKSSLVIIYSQIHTFNQYIFVVYF